MTPDTQTDPQAQSAPKHETPRTDAAIEDIKAICKQWSSGQIYAEDFVVCAAQAMVPFRAIEAENAALRKALERIANLDPKPIEYPFPEDWHAQIAACPECQAYKNHPIQGGICNKHRQPIWERERREENASNYLHADMRDIARRALGKGES